MSVMAMRSFRGGTAAVALYVFGFGVGRVAAVDVGGDGDFVTLRAFVQVPRGAVAGLLADGVERGHVEQRGARDAAGESGDVPEWVNWALMAVLLPVAYSLMFMAALWMNPEYRRTVYRLRKTEATLKDLMARAKYAADDCCQHSRFARETARRLAFDAEKAALRKEPARDGVQADKGTGTSHTGARHEHCQPGKESEAADLQHAAAVPLRVAAHACREPREVPSHGTHLRHERAGMAPHQVTI